MEFLQLKDFLELKYREYCTPDFIDNDPVCIPHMFTQPQDIEIAGLFAAVFAWGLRKTIINKCRLLMQLFGNAPYQFVTSHTPADLKPLLQFRHRTFNDTDLLYFMHFLQQHYRQHNTLLHAFTPPGVALPTIVQRLTFFHNYFFSSAYAPARTRKHIPSPASGSTCKRLNMYLRWMVRPATEGVDFGLWNSISTSQLICPCDVHSVRVAQRLGLISAAATLNWQLAATLTTALSTFCESDPVKYDYALFGLGVEYRL